VSSAVELSPVVPLGRAHVVGDFDSGDPDIDAFLRDRAATEQAMGFSQIYVTSDPAGSVAGYFTVSPVTVRVEPALLRTIGVGAAPYPLIGGFLLGRLGVARRLHGRGIGAALVMRAAQITKREAALVGGSFLAVDPKTEELVAWYARLDFVRLGEKTRRMVLPLRAVP